MNWARLSQIITMVRRPAGDNDLSFVITKIIRKAGRQNNHPHPTQDLEHKFLIRHQTILQDKNLIFF